MTCTLVTAREGLLVITCFKIIPVKLPFYMFSLLVVGVYSLEKKTKANMSEALTICFFQIVLLIA